MNHPVFWLGISILLVAISLMALLTVAILTLQELARAARSAEKLLDTLNRELPATLSDLRLTGQELSGLSQEVTGGMQSARSVVDQVDQGISEAKVQAQRINITTRSLWAGTAAAFRVLTGQPKRPSKRRRQRPPTRRPPISPMPPNPQTASQNTGNLKPDNSQTDNSQTGNSQTDNPQTSNLKPGNPTPNTLKPSNSSTEPSPPSHAHRAQNHPIDDESSSNSIHPRPQTAAPLPAENSQHQPSTQPPVQSAETTVQTDSANSATHHHGAKTSQSSLPIEQAPRPDDSHSAHPKPTTSPPSSPDSPGQQASSQQL